MLAGARTSPKCEIAGNGTGKFVSWQASASGGPHHLSRWVTPDGTVGFRRDGPPCSMHQGLLGIGDDLGRGPVQWPLVGKMVSMLVELHVGIVRVVFGHIAVHCTWPFCQFPVQVDGVHVSGEGSCDDVFPSFKGNRYGIDLPATVSSRYFSVMVNAL